MVLRALLETTIGALRVVRTIRTPCGAPYRLMTAGAYVLRPLESLRSNSGSGSGLGNRTQDRPNKPKKRFRIDSGSGQAQSALKFIITRIQEHTKNYNVNFVDPATNKLGTRHLGDITNKLDLDHQGILFIPQQGGLPLVKVIKVYDMIRNYSNELAQMREKELLQKGSIAAQKAQRQRDKAQKKKSATKVITLAWSISLGDLQNQKRAEIAKRVVKGGKFVLYIGERRSLYSARNSVNKEDGIIENLREGKVQSSISRKYDSEEVEFEMKKRSLIYEKVIAILEQLECEYESTGSLDARIMLSCTPKKQPVEQVEVPKKKKKSPSPKKTERKKQDDLDSEDLDALYLFKIED